MKPDEQEQTRVGSQNEPALRETRGFSRVALGSGLETLGLLSTPLGAVATAIYAAHVNNGHGDLDSTSVIKMIDPAV